MNAFLNPRNGTSLTSTIDVTAHNMSLFQANEKFKTINDMFIPKTDFNIAEPIEVQIDELGNSITQKYQLIGIINDEKVCGLESIFKCE